jgi:hypothetical protein
VIYRVIAVVAIASEAAALLQHAPAIQFASAWNLTLALITACGLHIAAAN